LSLSDIKVIFNSKHYRMTITAIVAITVMNNNRDFVCNLHTFTLSLSLILTLFSFFTFITFLRKNLKHICCEIDDCHHSNFYKENNTVFITTVLSLLRF